MMKTTKGIFLTLLFISTAHCLLMAQGERFISGSVIDKTTKLPLPFANISLKKKPIGTVADQEGKFTLPISQEVLSDTLMINYLGYKDYFLSLHSIQIPLIIELDQMVTQLSEVVVTPYPPTHYIKLAMMKMKDHYPKAPFQTEAYYREKVTENECLLKFDECIFKTNYPNFLDTVRNQHQLLLYRKPEKVQEMKFMAKERKEQEEKEYKKNPGAKRRTGNDFIFRSEGPGLLLYFSKINKRNDDFLDSTKFKHYQYSFANTSFYQGKEMIVIDFKSKGKVGYLKKEGKIYIDPGTGVIFRIEGSGDFIIPLAYRPLLFLYGFSAQELSFKGEKEYQQVNERWYPKEIHVNFKVIVTKRRLFGTNEHGDFDLEQIFLVNKLRTESISPIEPNKKFDPEKDMGSQIYNDSGASWSEINIINGNR